MHSKSELRRHAHGNPEALVKRIVELEEAIAKALRKADGNGMGEWPAFKALRAVMTKST